MRVSEATLYRRRKKYAHLGASELRRLRQTLARTDPDNRPLPPAVMHIATACQGVVALWSTADIFLPVRIQVPGTGFDLAQGLPGDWADPHARARLRAPDGTVVVTFGSRELVRLTDRTVAGCTN